MNTSDLNLDDVYTRAERSYAAAKVDAESLGAEVLPIVRQHFNYDIPALVSTIRKLTAELDEIGRMRVVEHEGRGLKVITTAMHDRLCTARVASRQEGTELLHCHFCDFCYPRQTPVGTAAQGTRAVTSHDLLAGDLMAACIDRGVDIDPADRQALRAVAGLGQDVVTAVISLIGRVNSRGYAAGTREVQKLREALSSAEDRVQELRIQLDRADQDGGVDRGSL